MQDLKNRFWRVAVALAPITAFALTLAAMKRWF
jgi:hypothetical protein